MRVDIATRCPELLVEASIVFSNAPMASEPAAALSNASFCDCFVVAERLGREGTAQSVFCNFAILD